LIIIPILEVATTNTATREFPPRRPPAANSAILRFGSDVALD